jgi:hypothetical protein
MFSPLAAVVLMVAGQDEGDLNLRLRRPDELGGRPIRRV